MDTAEDYKVCVTESLLILKRNGFLTASICFTVDGETLGCAISGAEKGGQKEDSMEDEISRALLSALVGNAVFSENEEGGVEKITFEA